MYSGKVEVLRFESEPYRKSHLDQNVRPNKNGLLHYNDKINNNNLEHKFIYHNGNGYHNTLIETETKPSSTTTAVAAATAVALSSIQPPSDPFIASVLHPRQNPRPGRLLLENVNNRPQTMDRGTQSDTDNNAADPMVITKAPSTSNDELYRNANISVTNQKLLTNGGDNSSVDSLHSADSAKRDGEEPAIELVEMRQPMITKDEGDGIINMSNGDGKHLGAGNKPSNGVVKEHPVNDDNDKPGCGMECLYFAMQCCECSIM